MPWPLERALLSGAGKAPDGVVHRLRYTTAGNYMFRCGAVMHEMHTRMDPSSTVSEIVMLSAVSHYTARKLLTDESIDCLLCLTDPEADED